MKTKFEAIKALMREARSERSSNAAAKRAVKAAEIIGLERWEIVELMGWLDYCDSAGNPYRDIERIW